MESKPIEVEIGEKAMKAQIIRDERRAPRQIPPRNYEHPPLKTYYN